MRPPSRAGQNLCLACKSLRSFSQNLPWGSTNSRESHTTHSFRHVSGVPHSGPNSLSWGHQHVTFNVAGGPRNKKDKRVLKVTGMRKFQKICDIQSLRRAAVGASGQKCLPVLTRKSYGSLAYPSCAETAGPSRMSPTRGPKQHAKGVSGHLSSNLLIKTTVFCWYL